MDEEIISIFSGLTALFSVLTVLLNQLQLMLSTRRKRKLSRTKRTVWVNPGRTDDWWVKTRDLSPESEWKSNFRMSRDDFHALVDLTRPYAKSRSTKIRKDVLSLEKRVAMALYYLKDQGSLRMSANSFGVAKSTLSVVLKEICTIIKEKLGPTLIVYPCSESEVRNTANEFMKKFGFPQTIGCIDGTHIPIKRTDENSQDYFSYNRRAIDLKLEFVPTLIYACFVLHNFCERRKSSVEVPQNILDEIISEELAYRLSGDKIYSYKTSEGGKVRDAVAEYFSEYL